MMKINVHNLPQAGLVLDFEEKPDAFPVLMDMAQAGECRFCGPISVHLRVLQVQELIEAAGQLTTSVQLNCSRCLKAFESQLSARLKLIYTRQALYPEAAGDQDEVELSAQQMGLIHFQGDDIDLNPALQEQIVMALPIKPLCKETCQGLCPYCGIDRNTAHCSCAGQPVASPFAILKDFHPKR
jgi:uncharacterized protein